MSDSKVADRRWVVEGVILAPTLPTLDAVRFMDCTIFPLASGPEWTPEPTGGIQLSPTGMPGPTQAFPARYRMFTSHRIATELEAADSDAANAAAISRFRRCAIGLVVTARVPAGSPIYAAPEALVQLTYAHSPDGVTNGPPGEAKIGVVLTREPTDTNRFAAGLLEQVLKADSWRPNLLEAFYVAEEAAYLAFSRRDEEYALLDYCKILEEISSQVAREHKEDADTQVAISREIDGIIGALTRTLNQELPLESRIAAVREAQFAISSANLESQKRQIVRAGELLLVPADIRPVFDRVWKLRSSTASHAGGTGWSGQALVDARTVAMIYLSHFIASRHTRDRGLTLAQAVEAARVPSIEAADTSIEEQTPPTDNSASEYQG